MLFKALKFTGGLALSMVSGAVDSDDTVDEDEQLPEQDINLYVNTDEDEELARIKLQHETYEFNRLRSKDISINN